MLASSWFISPKKVKLGLVLIEDLLLFSCSVVSDSSQPHGLQHTRFYVLHHLPALAPTHVHWVSNAIQLSRTLSSPSPPTLIFPRIGVFSNESALHIWWPKYWSFSITPSNEYSGWFPLRLTGFISVLSKGLSRVFSKPQFKSINSSMFSFLYGPALTSIHNYWKNHIYH